MIEFRTMSVRGRGMSNLFLPLIEYTESFLVKRSLSGVSECMDLCTNVAKLPTSLVQVAKQLLLTFTGANVFTKMCLLRCDLPQTSQVDDHRNRSSPCACLQQQVRWLL